MIDGEIKAALEGLNERKQAIRGEPPITVEEHDLVMLLSGFDLNPKELVLLLRSGAAHAKKVMGAGVEPDMMAALMLADGLALGLRIAENRTKAVA